MSWWEALVLGLLQGLTEFLPVSSSGHLQIGHALFGLQGEENLTFAVAVHAATVCSTVVVLWSEIAKLFKGLFRFAWNNETQYVAKIAVSMIPVFIVGVFFRAQVEQIFGSGLLVVGICLLITAALLSFAYYARPRAKENISFRDSFIIGVAQACAVLPGLSRSGATISAGLLLGNKKDAVANFSFLMVLVPILGEAILDLMKGGFSEGASGIPTISLAVGFLTAFAVGCVACKLMINVVKKGKLIYFAIYCAVVGAVMLALSACGII
jgi:undecaprenyl-diphosphatase